MSDLDFASDQFRALGDRVLRVAADYLSSLSSRPSFPDTSGRETERLLGGALPEEGRGDAVLDDLGAIAAHSRPGNGRFFAYVMGSGEPIGALGDLLAGVLNQNVTAWRSAPAAVTLERAVVRSLASRIGCDGFTGSLCGGGSAANLMGLAMAREARLPANEGGARPGVVYASTESHMSIAKAVCLLGLGRSNLRLVDVDERFRMVPQALADALRADQAAGRTPIAVVATAGTVNTGAIDPLPALADLAREHGAWLHVDGAYGALAALAVPERFGGLALADSLSLDPHKWLYQPLDCGCLLYQDAGRARHAFSRSGDYAKPLSGDPVEGFAFFDESLELSRRFRALRLWLSISFHGLAKFRSAIRADLAHAGRLAAAIGARSDLELLAPVELSAVCWRWVGEPRRPEGLLDAANSAILRRVIERGRVYISNATIHSRFALRACFTNHRTNEADVDAVVDEVIAAAEELQREG